MTAWRTRGDALDAGRAWVRHLQSFEIKVHHIMMIDPVTEAFDGVEDVVCGFGSLQVV